MCKNRYIVNRRIDALGASVSLAIQPAHQPRAMQETMPLRQLQGMDHSFVALETRTSPMHIGSLLIYNPETAPGGFVRFKDILAFYETRLPLSKTVRQRMVRVPFDLDYPYWIEDKEFDLE